MNKCLSTFVILLLSAGLVHSEDTIDQRTPLPALAGLKVFCAHQKITNKMMSIICLMKM